jgi:hypothetical protein
MEPGYTIDNAYGSKTLPEWVAGEPVSSLAARTSCRSSPIVAADADISKAAATAAAADYLHCCCQIASARLHSPRCGRAIAFFDF